MSEIETEVEQHGNGPVLAWFTRNYDSYQNWIKQAREVFFASNGASELARHRVATMIRSYFLDAQPQAEVVQKWTGLLKVDETVKPPKVTPSNASYFDWLRVADYLLLPAASSDDFVAENQKRESQYLQLMGSYTLRMQVNIAREVLRDNPSMDDDAVLKQVQKQYPKASLANVKEAKRLEAAKEPMRTPAKPERAGDLPRYQPLDSLTDA